METRHAHLVLLVDVGLVGRADIVLVQQEFDSREVAGLDSNMEGSRGQALTGQVGQGSGLQ